MLQIRTERLLLRDFDRADLPAYAALSREPIFQRFHPEEEVAGDQPERLLDMFIAWSGEHPRRRVQLAITGASGEVMGSCGVRVTSEEERQGSFGCELGPAFWGHGYAREAGRAMLDHGFRELGLHRIYAETMAENEAAVRLALSIGMRVEGVMRENRWFRGRWWSTTILAVLESEWSV